MNLNAIEAIALVAERKIEEAMAEGQFDNLPGMGKPLALEDTSHLPPDMRMAYTILKNAGYLEQSNQEQPTSMAELLQALPAEGQVYRKALRLKVLMAKVRKADRGFERQDPASEPTLDSPYLDELIRRV